jgi:hypothetical protein
MQACFGHDLDRNLPQFMVNMSFKRVGALSGIATIVFISYFNFEKLAAKFQLPESPPEDKPVSVSNQEKIESSDGMDFLARIKPAENIVDFYQAFSESLLVVKSYESLKRSNHINKSELVTYRDKLSEAYAVFLALCADENEDGKEVAARELHHCGNLITSIIEELATRSAGARDSGH